MVAMPGVRMLIRRIWGNRLISGGCRPIAVCETYYGMVFAPVDLWAILVGRTGSSDRCHVDGVVNAVVPALGQPAMTGPTRSAPGDPVVPCPASGADRWLCQMAILVEGTLDQDVSRQHAA
jgi:hypothetical protein